MSEAGDLRHEKRGNVRDPVRRSARLELAEQSLKGLTRDISSGGVFMFTGDELVARLVIDEDGDERRVHSVRLVRLETIPGGGLGIAVEYVD